MLNELQQLLTRIYETETAHDVYDYLITDPRVARQYEGLGQRKVEEKVLVEQRGDTVDIALYLNQELLAGLAEDNPLDSLHEGNLQEFLVVLEGISHFNYLAWNIPFDRRVTLLELEMQAEVDKYVASLFLLCRQCNGVVPRSLHGSLFANATFDPALDDEERERYHRAHFYAGKYCRKLESRYLLRQVPGLLNELRRFYRFSQNAKIRHINH